MKQNDHWMAQVARYSSLAFVLPISTLVGLGIGWGLDKLFHTHFLYIVFLLIGIAAGFLDVYRMLESESHRDDS